MTFCNKCVHKTDRKSLMQKFVADSDLSFLNVGLKVVPLSVERGRRGGGGGGGGGGDWYSKEPSTKIFGKDDTVHT